MRADSGTHTPAAPRQLRTSARFFTIPRVSCEPTPQWTVGAGVSFQRLNAELTKQVNYTAAFAQGVQAAIVANPSLAPFAQTLIGSAAGLESGAKVKGDDSSWGWNAGVLW